MAKEKCCYIGAESQQCLADARFRILPAPGQDVYSDTYACTLHVGDLLDDDSNGHLVMPETE